MISQDFIIFYKSPFSSKCSSKREVATKERKKYLVLSTFFCTHTRTHDKLLIYKSGLDTKQDFKALHNAL